MPSRANEFPRATKETVVSFNKPSATEAQDRTPAIAITRYRTKLHLRCSGCRRQSFATIFLNEVPRLRCRECGARNPDVLSRDRLAAWARQRRGQLTEPHMP